MVWRSKQRTTRRSTNQAEARTPFFKDQENGFVNKNLSTNQKFAEKKKYQVGSISEKVHKKVHISVPFRTLYDAQLSAYDEDTRIEEIS